MRLFLIIICFFLIPSCSSNKYVYWCGDHQCINKKEKEAYFKKTMIVEIKELSEIKENKSEIEKITQQARINEKKRIKEEKALAKQAKIEEKRRIKNEKKLAKQAKIEEKRKTKEEKKLAKKIKKNQKKITEKVIEKDEINVEESKNKINKFSQIVEKITNRNMFRPYPDINDIKN